ncbi:unnamed protein product [Trifolium pratense]|uniref:Uncharacterized protein n=1 Tax=Trifolium pratense TaxID=57577 RepID=A0ACB0M5Y2_TRIPR|nr:unnamed protein product [Trifolium pratense]
MLRSCGKSLKDYPPMPRADTSLVLGIQNSLIHDELNYNRQSLAEEHVRLMSTMTSEQRKVYDTIMTRVNENKPGVFFFMVMAVQGRHLSEGPCQSHYAQKVR